MSSGRRAIFAAVCIAIGLVLFFYPAQLRTRQTGQILPAAHDAYTATGEQPPQNAQPGLTKSQRPSSLSSLPSSLSSSQSKGPECGLIKVSMLYGAHKFPQLEGALETHEKHSQRWGCGFESLGYDLIDRKLYSKQYFLLSIMLDELSKPAATRKEWLMWVDADSILINPALSPEVFLPPDHLKDVYALLTADHNGLNAGIFFLRVHPRSVDLLTQTVAYPLVHPEEDLGWFGEQAAMANVIKALEANPPATGDYPGIAWVPRMWFNAYQFESGFEGQPGHMLVHFAGLAETRISHMANWLDELQRNQAKWEIPLASTFYKDEISKFWAEFPANSSGRV